METDHPWIAARWRVADAVSRRQFRTLYREFLFRMVDLELLSPDAQGDAGKLLGRFAALLVFFSAYLGLGGLLFDRKDMPPAMFQTLSFGMEHFLISTTMLIVGLFAVLSWDSTFPDRRDVLVLGPLPIRTETMFLAKIAAAASSLGLAIVGFNAGPGLTWPLALSTDQGFLSMALPFAHRSFFAYWITMSAAGTFLFCCVLGVQGVAALLPRRIFLRLTALLQLGAFCSFMSAYFLEPALVTPRALAAPENHRLLCWLPDYWFLGLFQQLNGTAIRETAPLAHRAWIGLSIATGTTAIAYALSYFRTVRKVVEEPDIVPGKPFRNWSPRWGDSVQTAIVQFSIRALARSRQHRVIFSFYLGMGFAILILLSKAQPPAGQTYPPPPPENLGPIVSSIMVLCFWMLGTRVIFSLPLNLRANWVFRVTPVRGGPGSLSAARRSLYVLAWAPLWTGNAIWFLSIWPWRMAVGHLIAFGLVGAILVELCLYNFQKIPFTCSWLPGKSNIILGLGGFSFLLLLLLIQGATMELSALADPFRYAETIAILTAVFAAARWRTSARASTEQPVVQFGEEQKSVLLGLGLFRDGVLPSRAAE